MRVAYLNKKFIPLKKAKISMLDRGFLYGDGVFETMRSYSGAVFLLEEHLERLSRSLKRLGIKANMKKPRIKKVVYDLLKKNNLKNAYIKIIVTRGKSSGLLVPRRPVKPTIAIYVLPYTGLNNKLHEYGVKLGICKTRLNEQSAIVGNKTLNYLDNILCRYDAENKNFDDNIIVNTRGFVSETTSSNIFAVRKNILYTPSLKSGCLPGITRKEILRISRSLLKVKVKETLIKQNSLFKSDEIFISNSLIEILPAKSVGNKIIGEGSPGPVTKELIKLYRASVYKYCRKAIG